MSYAPCITLFTDAWWRRTPAAARMKLSSPSNSSSRARAQLPSDGKQLVHIKRRGHDEQRKLCAVAAFMKPTRADAGETLNAAAGRHHNSQHGILFVSYTAQKRRQTGRAVPSQPHRESGIASRRLARRHQAGYNEGLAPPKRPQHRVRRCRFSAWVPLFRRPATA